MSRLTLISPRPSETGSISQKTRRTSGSAVREREAEAAAAAAQPWQRQRELDGRAEEDSDRVGVQAVVDRVPERRRTHQHGDDHDVPRHRRDRRNEELVERVQHRAHDARQAEQDERREQHAREPDRRASCGSRTAAITCGASTSNTSVTAERPTNDSQKTLDATRHARSRSPRCSRSLKTGTNAAPSAESATSARTRFGTWNATVNALIDSLHAEERRRDDLAQHAHDPAETGRDREQRGRDRQATPRGGLERRGGVGLGHRARIGTRPAGPGLATGRERPDRARFRGGARPSRASRAFRSALQGHSGEHQAAEEARQGLRP